MVEKEDGAGSLISLSKVMSKVLRHEPELVRIKLDKEGWVDVAVLVDALNAAARASVNKRLARLGPVSREMLEEVVRTSDKQRFALSVDGLRVRAVQGHSVQVTLGYTAAVPPPVLYHGTAVTTWPAIDQAGLLPMSRQQVHLSADVPTALRVGRRHGKPLLLEVDASLMHREGATFYKADNGVWLVDHVPRRHLKKTRIG